MYLVAKKTGDCGCIAYQTQHGKKLADLVKKLNHDVGKYGVQLVSVSRPEAYGEYAPYVFADNEDLFYKMVLELFTV